MQAYLFILYRYLLRARGYSAMLLVFVILAMTVGSASSILSLNTLYSLQSRTLESYRLFVPDIKVALPSAHEYPVNSMAHEYPILIEHQDQRLLGMALALPNPLFNPNISLQKSIITQQKESEGVYLHASIAHRLKIQIGDNIKLISTDILPTIGGIMQSYITTKVAAIYYTPQIYPAIVMDSEILASVVSVQPNYAYLKSTSTIENGITWQQQLLDIITALSVEHIVVNVLVAFVLLISLALMYYLLAVFITEKTYDMRLLSMLGMSDKIVFFVEGVILSCLGIALGLVVSYISWPYITSWLGLPVLDLINIDVILMTLCALSWTILFYLSTVEVRKLR